MYSPSTERMRPTTGDLAPCILHTVSIHADATITPPFGAGATWPSVWACVSVLRSPAIRGSKGVPCLSHTDIGGRAREPRGGASPNHPFAGCSHQAPVTLPGIQGCKRLLVKKRALPHIGCPACPEHGPRRKKMRRVTLLGIAAALVVAPALALSVGSDDDTSSIARRKCGLLRIHPKPLSSSALAQVAPNHRRPSRMTMPVRLTRGGWRPSGTRRSSRHSCGVSLAPAFRRWGRSASS